MCEAIVVWVPQEETRLTYHDYSGDSSILLPAVCLQSFTDASYIECACFGNHRSKHA